MDKVSVSDAERICSDAQIAVDCLNAVVNECGGAYVSRRYLLEKVSKAMLCCEFITSVLDVDGQVV